MQNDREAQKLAEDGLRLLQNLGLLEKEQDGAFRIHRLLAAFVNTQFDMDEALAMVEETLLQEVSQEKYQHSPLKILPLLPHLQHIALRAMSCTTEKAAVFLDRFGSVLHSLGKYHQARPYLEQAYSIFKEQLGPDDPRTIATLHNFAAVVFAQREIDLAYELHKSLLASMDRTQAPRDIDMAKTLSGAARVFQRKKELEDALRLAERAVSIYEEVCGPMDIATAHGLTVLSLVYDAQGKLDLACELAERVLSIYEKELEPTHHSIAVSLNNLGNLRGQQGDFDTARNCLERALSIWEAISVEHGHQYRDRGSAHHNLALVLMAQGEVAEARTHFQEALNILCGTLGPNHEHTKRTFDRLHQLLQKIDPDALARLKDGPCSF